MAVKTINLDIKPLSVNDAWQGRRFKTPKYKNYEKNCLLLLPKMDVPKGKLQLEIIVRFSNASSDIDNIIKPIVDIMQKKYPFNDKHIYRLIIDKEIVEKGKEGFEITITELSK